MKTGGYPADWAEYLIGHSIGTQESYIPPTDTLGQEWLKIERQFCFLGNPSGSEAVIIDRDGSKSEIPDTVPVQESSQGPATMRSMISTVRSKPSSCTNRWASKSYSYVKTFISSSDYDQALADGYRIFDEDGALRGLRKRGNHLTSYDGDRNQSGSNCRVTFTILTLFSLPNDPLFVGIIVAKVVISRMS